MTDEIADRIAKALESIADSLVKIANPLVQIRPVPTQREIRANDELRWIHQLQDCA